MEQFLPRNPARHNASASTAPPAPTAPRSKMQRDADVFLAKHPHAIMYGLIGLAVAILILAIGLGATLLLAILAGIGITVGRYQDGDSHVRLAVNRLIRRFS